jgi:capsular exopolysaccharide synthesis family protein
MENFKDFDFVKSNLPSIDIKALLFKLLKGWKWIVLSVLLALGIAYYINVRKKFLYRMDTKISVKDEQNPFFTSNMNLTFNWGGASDKVETMITTLRSRTHNEQVVESLDYYIQYLKENEYYFNDIYGKNPFIIKLDKSRAQVLNQLIKIEVLADNKLKVSVVFEQSSITLMNYKSLETYPFQLKNELNYEKIVSYGEEIIFPFMKFTIVRNEIVANNAGIYYIKLLSFNGVVASYKNIEVKQISKSSSILELSMVGENKEKLANYLNHTVSILKQNQLKKKNLFAANTIAFIDRELAGVGDSLKKAERKLEKFRSKNQIFDLSTEGGKIYEDMSAFEAERMAIDRKVSYYNLLDTYLRNKNFTRISSPSAVGIEEPNIISGVAKLVAMAVQKEQLSQSLRADNPLMQELDGKIAAREQVIKENIRSAKALLKSDKIAVNKRIGQLQYKYKKLPVAEQQLSNMRRVYDLSEASYNMLLEKRNQAGIAMAANVSDVTVIDDAKDIGQGSIAPNKQLNYIIALVLGLLTPIFLIILFALFDSTITTIDELKNETKIPFLGIIGKNNTKDDLAVYNKPRSGTAESFRAIRSSLQFFYKGLNTAVANKVLVTSSVSGEGKTFIAKNIATVFALSGKKVLLLGLDLRKPRIHEGFDIDENLGAVNYLIGDKSITEIIQYTKIDNLDIITSGPIPPNPSELLLSDSLKILIETLEQNYDYLIIDTPPVGLVSDAFEIAQYVDASIYVVRQGYSKKGMLDMINDKYDKEEIKHISVLFNDVASGKGYGYGYGYGYGAYANGYHQDDKKKSFFARLFKK